MTRQVVLYGKVYTTSDVFVHLLRWFLAHHATDLSDLHFHLIFDDRRDRDRAASLLDPSRVTLHAQYERCRPDDPKQSWPSAVIREWERRYGSPHLRPYLATERILDGRPDEERWRYLFSHIEYFERLCQDLQPALFVTGPASVLASWVAIKVFQGNHVPCLILSPARFGNRCFTPEDAHERLNVGDLFREKLQRGLSRHERVEAQALMQQYRHKTIKPADFWVVKRTTRMRLVPRPTKIWRLWYETRYTDARYYDEPFRFVLLRALKARRTWWYRTWLRGQTMKQLPPQRPFFFFPLQFEPEMSLSTQGRGWADQLALIRLVSECLPIDRWLYVKEHPMMPCGVRPFRFYRELLQLPRVHLLDQRLDSYQIVLHAEAVITLGSTAGWEALMFGKPVLLAGRAFYEELIDAVVRLEQIEELPRALRQLRTCQISDEVVLAFIAAVLAKAPCGVLADPRHFPELAKMVLGDDNLEHLSRILLDRLRHISVSLEDGAGPVGQSRHRISSNDDESGNQTPGYGDECCRGQANNRGEDTGEIHDTNSFDLSAGTQKNPPAD